MRLLKVCYNALPDIVSAVAKFVFSLFFASHFQNKMEIVSASLRF